MNQLKKLNILSKADRQNGHGGRPATTTLPVIEPRRRGGVGRLRVPGRPFSLVSPGLSGSHGSVGHSSRFRDLAGVMIDVVEQIEPDAGCWPQYMPG
jgi:hypothetical protein